MLASLGVSGLKCTRKKRVIEILKELLQLPSTGVLPPLQPRSGRSVANQFQQGQDALWFLNTSYHTMIRPSELRELDQLWNELNIVNDVGISEESIDKFSKLLMRVNGERLEGKRFSASVVTGKLL